VGKAGLKYFCYTEKFHDRATFMQAVKVFDQVAGFTVPLVVGAVLGVLLHTACPGKYPVSAIPGLAGWATLLYWTCLALGGSWYPLLNHDLRFLDKLNQRLLTKELRVVYTTPSLPLRLKEYELLDSKGRSVRRNMSWEDVRALGKQTSMGTRAD
jgi:hypothetical protein